MFATEIHYVPTVAGNFQNLLKYLEDVSAPNRNGLLYFTAHSDPHDLNGDAICNPPNKDPSWDFVIPTPGFKEIVDWKSSGQGGGLPPGDAYITNFCDGFLTNSMASDLFARLHSGHMFPADVPSHTARDDASTLGRWTRIARSRAS